MSLSLIKFAAVSVCCVIGSTIQTTIGFGSGFALMGFLPHFFESVASVTVINGMASFASSAGAAYQTRGKRNWKTIKTMVPLYFISMPVGQWLLMRVPNRTAKVLLGVAIIVFALYNLLVKEFRFKPSVLSAVICGCLGGALSGMFGLAGPPIVVYIANSTENKDEIIGTSSMIFTITTFYATIVRFIGGLITKELFIYAAWGMCFMLIGVKLGGLIRARLNIAQIKKGIYAFFIISGLGLLF